MPTARSSVAMSSAVIAVEVKMASAFRMVVRASSSDAATTRSMPRFASSDRSTS